MNDWKTLDHCISLNMLTYEEQQHIKNSDIDLWEYYKSKYFIMNLNADLPHLPNGIIIILYKNRKKDVMLDRLLGVK